MSGKSGHLPGMGPVFVYEWLISSRRWQGYALRSLFVAFLLAALVTTWLRRGDFGNVATISGLAQLGEIFYQALIGTQLTLVLLAAPAATAGAICLDRARGTLAHLMVTDLSDGEIVLGKLAARLVPVLGLVGCALPVMAILTLLGGVDPNALSGAFLVTIGVAVLGCSLALTFSLWAGKTHEALLGTYAVWGLWLLGKPMIDELNRTLGSSLPVPIETAHPFLLAFGPYAGPGRFGWGDYLAFLGVTWTISAVLVSLAVLRLRSVCLRESVRRGERRTPRLGARIARTWRRLVPGPTLDQNPVLWREWHRSRPSRWARIVGGLFVTLTVVFSLIAMVSGSGNVSAWTNGLQVSIGLLLLSVTAASSLAEERVRGSLDVLMTTPLSTRQIVLGKWMGTFRLVPPLTILPALVLLAGGELDMLRGWVVFLMVAFIFCSGAAITSLGLAMATWFSRLGRAVGLTVSLYVLVAVGWLFAAMIFSHGREGQGLMMGSPFFWAGQISFDMCGRQAVDHLFEAFCWTIAYAVAAYVILQSTLQSFNRCLGRIENGVPRPGPIDKRAVKPVILEEIVGESIEVV